jgi:hypothetical protein
MRPFLDMQFGDRIITLMAALVLVLQIAVVAQRWIVTHIRIFAIQSSRHDCRNHRLVQPRAAYLHRRRAHPRCEGDSGAHPL